MVSFLTLWNNHPGSGNFPCQDKAGYQNQCAMRMGVALEKSGVDLSTYKGLRCSESAKHIRGAQDLANWISKQTVHFGKMQIYEKVTDSDFKGQKGIVFVENGWGTTDHIDVWDGSNMKGGSPQYFAYGKKIYFWKLN